MPHTGEQNLAPDASMKRKPHCRQLRCTARLALAGAAADAELPARRGGKGGECSSCKSFHKSKVGRRPGRDRDRITASSGSGTMHSTSRPTEESRARRTERPDRRAVAKHIARDVASDDGAGRDASRGESASVGVGHARGDVAVVDCPTGHEGVVAKLCH